MSSVGRRVEDESVIPGLSSGTRRPLQRGTRAPSLHRASGRCRSRCTGDGGDGGAAAPRNAQRKCGGAFRSPRAGTPTVTCTPLSKQ